MMHALPFVALWLDDHAAGDTVVHLLNRDTHQTMPLPDLAANPQAVEEFLPDLARAVPPPDPAARWLLLLEPSLPQSWQRLRWEALHLRGDPFQRRLS